MNRSFPLSAVLAVLAAAAVYASAAATEQVTMTSPRVASIGATSVTLNNHCTAYLTPQTPLTGRTSTGAAVNPPTALVNGKVNPNITVGIFALAAGPLKRPLTPCRFTATSFEIQPYPTTTATPRPNTRPHH